RGALLPRGAPRSAANSASTSRRDSAREFTICVIEDANSAHESRNRTDFRAIVHLDVILSIVRQQLHRVPAFCSACDTGRKSSSPDVTLVISTSNYVVRPE